jgi:hypothetical protein
MKLKILIIIIAFNLNAYQDKTHWLKERYNKIKQWISNNPMKTMGILALTLPAGLAAAEEENNANRRALAAIWALGISSIGLMPEEF